MSSPCPSPSMLEAFALGEENEGIAAHVDACEVCGSLVEEIRANEAFLGFARGQLRATIASAGKEGVRHEVFGYELREEIARGGQGVVYRGIQMSTRREAAVKLLTSGVFADEHQRRRFDREIELAAGLRSPYLVTVYESGTTKDGDRFVAMELVHGAPIDRYVEERAPFGRCDARDRCDVVLRLMGMVACGVGHAHGVGIIHRDLKPSNILVESDGTPRVLDFGVARSVLTPSDMTITHSFLGTPAYAAPEQFQGDGMSVGTRADVYALGVILYRLLTGHPPYSCDGSFVDVARNARESHPVPPSRLLRGLMSDVDTIVLTCLAKEPERRYPSAAELAADLAGFLECRPIRAKRDNLIYLLRMWSRRHRAAALGIFLFFVTIIGAAAGLAVLANDLNDARQDAESALTASEVQRARLIAGAGGSSRAENMLWRSVLRERTTHQSTGLPIRAEWALRELYSRTGAVLTVQTGAPVMGVGFESDDSLWSIDVSGARTTWGSRGEVVSRRKGPPLSAEPLAATPNADASVIVIRSRDELVVHWPLESRIARRAYGANLSKPGPWLQPSNDGNLVLLSNVRERVAAELWDGRTLDTIARLDEACLFATFDRLDGETVLLEGLWLPAAHAVVVRQGPDWGVRATADLPPEFRALALPGVRACTLVGDGSRLFAAAGENMMLWDISSPIGHVMGKRSCRAPVTLARCVPREDFVVAALLDGTLMVVKGDSLDLLREIPEQGEVRSLAPSKSTRRAALGYDDGRLRVFEIDDRTWLHRIDSTPVTHASVAATADGSLAWVDDDGNLHIRGAESGGTDVTASAHRGVATSVQFSPDGSELLTGGMDGSVRCWTRHGAAKRTIATGLPRIWCARYSPDGTQIAASCDGGGVYLWKDGVAPLFLDMTDGGDRVPKIAWNRSSTRIYAAGLRGAITEWDARTGARTRTLSGVAARLRALACSPTGDLIAAAGDDRAVRLWDAVTGRLVREISGLPWGVFDLAFHPAGRLLFAVGRGGELVVLDAAEGEELARLSVHERQIFGLCTSADGTHVYTAGQDSWLGDTDLSHLDRYLEGNRQAWESITSSSSIEIPGGAAVGR